MQVARGARRCERRVWPNSSAALAGEPLPLPPDLAAPYFTASRPVHRTLSAATCSPRGFKGLAVERLPRGTGKDKAAEDCPDGLLWQTEFMDIKPAELPTLDWMHFS